MKIIILIISTIILIKTNPINASEFVNHRENISNIEVNLSNLNPQKIKPIGNSGIYELIIENEKYISSHDGRYLIIYEEILETFNQGSVINKPNNYYLSEKTFYLINSINKNKLITYKTENKKNKIYVLMDYTCPFCQNFHKEIKNDFIKNNYEVVYLPFRRSNDKEIFNNNKNIFCLEENEKKQKIYNEIIKTNNIKNINKEINECKNEAYYDLIEKILLTINKNLVTPVIIGENGIIIEGLRDFKDYHKILNFKEPKIENNKHKRF